MKTYYWESKDLHGQFQAPTDATARRIAIQSRYMVVYRESDTVDGRPFIVIWERFEYWLKPTETFKEKLEWE